MYVSTRQRSKYFDFFRVCVRVPVHRDLFNFWYEFSLSFPLFCVIRTSVLSFPRGLLTTIVLHMWTNTIYKIKYQLLYNVIHSISYYISMRHAIIVYEVLHQEMVHIYQVSLTTTGNRINITKEEKL